MNTLIVALVISSLAFANAKPSGYLNGHGLENDLLHSSSIGLIDDHVEHVPVVTGAIQSTSSVVHTELEQTHPSPAVVAHHDVILGHDEGVIVDHDSAWNHDGAWDHDDVLDHDDSWHHDDSWEHNDSWDHDDDSSEEDHDVVLVHETPIVAESHDTVVSTHLEQTHPSPVLVHDDHHDDLHGVVAAAVHVPIVTEVHAPLLTEVHAPILTEVHAPVLTEVHAPVLTEVHTPVISEEKIVSTHIDQTHVSPVVIEDHHDGILAAPVALIVDAHHDSLLLSHH